MAVRTVESLAETRQGVQLEDADVTEYLNGKFDDGWRLLAVIQRGEGVQFIFERKA